MKKELIRTEDYILVVDESEIKVGDCYLSPSGIWYYNHLNPNHIKDCKKVIAHLPLNDSPIIKGVPLLPYIDYSEMYKGYFDILLNPIDPTHFEFEMERGFENSLGDFSTSLNSLSPVAPIKCISKIKTITNAQGQTVVCGKYLFEL